jgi:hypothetical protein
MLIARSTIVRDVRARRRGRMPTALLDYNALQIQHGGGSGVIVMERGLPQCQ